LASWYPSEQWAKAVAFPIPRVYILQLKILLTYPPDKGLYNPSGRGYPDISAQGLYFQFYWNATNGVISGTSASTPLMASILALVNDALIASGKPTLGFLNPWLYKKGYKGFTDILSGGNGGCNTTGFPVTEDWDAVTGFGTPVFPDIVRLAKGEGSWTGG
jgi:tripeptidyl-peptidase-1